MWLRHCFVVQCEWKLLSTLTFRHQSRNKFIDFSKTLWDHVETFAIQIIKPLKSFLRGFTAMFCRRLKHMNLSRCVHTFSCSCPIAQFSITWKLQNNVLSTDYNTVKKWCAICVWKGFESQWFNDKELTFDLKIDEALFSRPKRYLYKLHRELFVLFWVNVQKNLVYVTNI